MKLRSYFLSRRFAVLLDFSFYQIGDPFFTFFDSFLIPFRSFGAKRSRYYSGLNFLALRYRRGLKTVRDLRKGLEGLYSLPFREGFPLTRSFVTPRSTAFHNDRGVSQK